MLWWNSKPTQSRMQRHPCASLFKLSARACSDCLPGLVQNACKRSSKLPVRVRSNWLQGFVQVACKRLFQLPARAYSSLRGFLQTACKGLSAIAFFTPAVSCADMLLWPLWMRMRKKQMKRRKPVRQPSSQQVKLILVHQLRRLMLPSDWWVKVLLITYGLYMACMQPSPKLGHGH